MKRREFITLLGGAAAAWPLVAQAQQSPLPIIGFLNAQSESGFLHLVAAFHAGLHDAGFAVGQDVTIGYRWADRQLERVPALAADLLGRGIFVLVATGGAHAAAIAASSTTPIVCSFGGDPVKAGFVKSINRPGGNVTGVMVLTTDLEAKRLELLHELVPAPGQIGVMFDPTFPDSKEHLQQMEFAAAALGRKLHVVSASTDAQIEAAFDVLVGQRVSALAIGGGPFFNNRRERIIALATRHSIPAIHENRETALAGGLLSYGVSVPGVYHQIGGYTGRILKGEKPSELPVLLPTKFDMAVNLKTARALGIAIPTALLLRADAVIE